MDSENGKGKGKAKAKEKVKKGGKKAASSTASSSEESGETSSGGETFLFIQDKLIQPSFSKPVTLSVGQSAKKVVSDSPGLVDFAIRLVNSVFNLPDGQGMFFEEFE